ncbi:MAG: L,D-transpeptidase family protein [Thermoanaerobaculia bacterium]
MLLVPARIVLAATIALAAVPVVAEPAASRPPAAVTALAFVQDGLPVDAPQEGLVVTIDVSKNKLYLFRDGTRVVETAVATGSDKILRKGTRTWWFRTPRGLHTVQGRIKDPVWRKPDWAFIEEGKKVPPGNSPLRLEKGPMGKYALDLGGGILIHGTDQPASLGKKASHGCIRVASRPLQTLWKHVTVGTPVYVFESERNAALGKSTGLNDLELMLEE